MVATSSKQFKNVCVLYNIQYRKYKEFIWAAVDLSLVIVDKKLHFVYRRCDEGYQSLSHTYYYITNNPAPQRGSKI